ncbi:predicted membrane protein [Lachnospiraceae bacterium KM106-2]|nr:predicted membrane protein [Lachnospiraceae bacterium KM106-2]
MNYIIKVMGYRGEVLSYCTKRVCGIWFCIIGVTILLATILGGNLCVNPPIFLLGYGIGFYCCYGNRKLIFDQLAQGTQSPFQKKTSNIAVDAIIIMGTVIGMTAWITKINPRTIWLLMFLAVGIHFCFFYFVHGRLVVFLGVFGVALAIVGLLVSQIPFPVFGTIDGASKIAVGIYFFFFSKVTNNRKESYYINYAK